MAIHDPYEDLDGYYEVELIDLIKESEHYDPEGLLCWMPRLKRFGCVDEDHGVVISFTAFWLDIVRDPAGHLDSQWGLGSVPVEEMLPWLQFRFALERRDLILDPYPSICPIHRDTITIERASSPVLSRVYRRRERDAWLASYSSEFPCSGVPANEHELKFCWRCRDLELQWVRAVQNAIPILDAKLNSHGWVQCPGCGIRFSASDDAVFQFGTHLTCGQRINVVS